jgi:hypothetical protein
MSQVGDERYDALGSVVERAAVMEVALRLAFCALAGGQYAAVIAGGQEAHWLIDTCEVIARHHTELPHEQVEAIRLALRACREASRDRNRLVHDAWGAGPDGAPVTVASAVRSYEVTGRPWAIADIRAVAAAIVVAQQDLLTSVEEALGPASLDAARHLLATDTRERRP